MKLLLQRVTSANVSVEGNVVGAIKKGFLLFLGVEESDTNEQLKFLVNKVLKLRVFENEKGKLDKSIVEVEGSILVVSQFTLCGSVKKGSRPSFSSAKKPEEAKKIYDHFIEMLNLNSELIIESGVFGADMKVELINDGPFTLFLES